MCVGGDCEKAKFEFASVEGKVEVELKAELGKMT